MYNTRMKNLYWHIGIIDYFIEDKEKSIKVKSTKNLGIDGSNEPPPEEYSLRFQEFLKEVLLKKSEFSDEDESDDDYDDFGD